MDINKLKIKIGTNEFEAEGPTDAVQAQFESFKELVANVPVAPIQSPPPLAGFGPFVSPDGEAKQTIKEPPPSNLNDVDKSLVKIMNVERRVVSLTVRPKTLNDAILALLYGQKLLRHSDAVTGAEVMDGLKATGGVSVTRVDKPLEKAGVAGDVIVTGEHRAKRYRLTNTGLAKARKIANDMIAQIAVL